MVIEDDIVYSEKFFSQLDMLIQQLRDINWDVVYLSQPSENMLLTNTLSVTPMNTHNFVLPCCDGYLLNKEFAKKLMIDFFPIQFEFNIQLSFVMNKIESNKIYKCYPNLTGDGSKTGKYMSSIQVNNVLIFNEEYKFVYSILESDNFTDEHIQKINKIMSTEMASSNADFVYLNGLYNMKIRNYEESKKLFDKAIHMYETNGIEIDNSSSLLKNRIHLEKFQQKDA
jgi:GR25 family glycosyltransferase involved in LPS biosynthesis